MTADLVGLADCPFCGKAAQVLLTTDAHNQAIVCNSGDGGCGARGPYRSNGIWARTAWNTRAELRAMGGGNYRLLTARDVIQTGDEILADSTTEWLPLSGWERGMQYNPGSLMPMRRKDSPAATVEG